MNFLLLISFRNLLRQKRRNLLLGAAIAIGMAVLVIAHAFSHGISDVMFNRILTYVTGHVSVAFSVKGNMMQPVFRDGERMFAIARETLPDAVRLNEAVGIFARAVGRGVADNVILIGMNLEEDITPEEQAQLKANFGMVEGAFEDVAREDLENPVLMAREKAEYLKVKRGEILRARFQDVYGRNQAVRLTVAGIFEPANIFMTAPVFMDLGRLKNLAGYGPNAISGFHINLKKPKENAVRAADSLHKALRPPLAAAHGRLTAGPPVRSMSRETASAPRPAGSSPRRGPAPAPSVSATVLGFQVDTASLKGLARVLGLPAPDLGPDPEAIGGLDTTEEGALSGRAAARASGTAHPRAVLAGHALADALGLRPGDRCTLTYVPKHGEGLVKAVFEVTGVLPPSAPIPGHVLLVNDRDFYGFYYNAWPVRPRPEDGAFLPDSGHAVRAFLAPEWVLLDRTRTTEEMQQKYRSATRMKTRATLVDVQTMYESASMIVNLEYALNLITLAAVLILFFIIQVGVVNTLRMTIRERTREIGTMRAIGMPKADVRAQFLLETFFLSAAACLAGILLAFLGMFLLRLMHFDVQGNPMGMLLVDGRLHFKPTALGIGLYLLLILAIAAVTAWFPARRAANLPPSEALRHFG